MGKMTLQLEENNWLKSMKSIRSSFCKDLHAKCYLNEKEAIITSMNLYEFSQVNNNEMGIYIEKEKDPELYKDMYDEVQRLIRISEELTVTVEKISPPEKQKEEAKTSADPNNGFCIRTGIPIPFNVEKPLSPEAYKKWSEYKDENYQEKYCHFSGEQSNGKTTVKMPILKSNWKRAKEKYKL